MDQTDCKVEGLPPWCINNTLETRVILTEAEISLAKADLVDAPITLLKTTHACGTISECIDMLMQTLCM